MHSLFASSCAGLHGRSWSGKHRVLCAHAWHHRQTEPPASTVHLNTISMPATGLSLSRSSKLAQNNPTSDAGKLTPELRKALQVLQSGFEQLPACASPIPTARLRPDPERRAQFAWHCPSIMLSSSRSAAPAFRRALRGAVQRSWRGGVSFAGVSKPTACFEYTSSVEHAWEAMMGSVPQREYVSVAHVGRSLPGGGVACFSSSAKLPSPDTVLLAMGEESVHMPGGLHTALRDLGLDEAVEFLPSELPLGSNPTTATALAIALTSMPALLQGLDEQARKAAAREVKMNMEKFVLAPSFLINKEFIETYMVLTPELREHVVQVLFSGAMTDVRAAADAASRAADEDKAKAKASWAAAMASVGVSNVVLPLREVLLGSATGQEFLPDGSHRRAVQHVLGWQLGLGKAMLKGKRGVLQWFAHAEDELQRKYYREVEDGADVADSGYAPNGSVDTAGLEPVFDQNGMLESFSTRFFLPVPREGKKSGDVQQVHGICAAVDDEVAPSLLPLTQEPKSAGFIHLPTVQPRPDGTLAQLPREAVRTLSLEWTEEHKSFLAQVADRLVSTGPGHRLIGVHGCGNSTILAALASIAAVGAGADVLYVRDGLAHVGGEGNPLLQGLSTRPGDSHSGEKLRLHMQPTQSSFGQSTKVAMNELAISMGLIESGPAENPRLLVMEEVHDLDQQVRGGQPSCLAEDVQPCPDSEDHNMKVGTMDVVTSSPDTSLGLAIKGQLWDVFADLGQAATGTMAALPGSGVGPEPSLAGAERQGVTDASTSQADRELEELLLYYSAMPGILLPDRRNVQDTGHKQALWATFHQVSDELKDSLERQLRESGKLDELSWLVLSSVTWNIHTQHQLDWLADASLLTRLSVQFTRLWGNARFVSLAARHAVLRVLLDRKGRGPRRHEYTWQIGVYPSQQTHIGKEVAELLALGACGHRALAVGQTFVPKEVLDTWEYPNKESASELMKVVSPASVSKTPRLGHMGRMSAWDEGGEDKPQASGVPPSQVTGKSFLMPADSLTSLHNLQPGDAWVVQPLDKNLGLDALQVFCDEKGGKHAVFVAATHLDLYRHASKKPEYEGVPAALRGIAQVVLSEGSHLESLKDGSVKMSHMGGEGSDASTSGPLSGQGTEGGLTLANAWLELLGADVRVKAEQLPAGGARGSGDEHGTEQNTDKKLRVTAVPKVEGSSPEWRVHMLYVTCRNIEDNTKYLDGCSEFLDSPLVHVMMGGDFLPLPAPSAAK